MVLALILNYNGLAMTRDCCAALARQTAASELRVLVVENGSKANTAEELAAACPNAEVVHTPVNLGFSGSGVMEYEMSEHLAAIDASCYVLDCLWNMGSTSVGNLPGRFVEENYEPFIRNLRAKRPGVPIVMAEMCDVYCGEPNSKDRCVKRLYDKLVAEGWKDLVYLPKSAMYTDDLEGTVDGCHPNDWGMMSLADAFGEAVREALALPRR